MAGFCTITVKPMGEPVASDRVRRAVATMFPDDADEVLTTLVNATGAERVHADILVFAFGDPDSLKTLVESAKLDTRNILMKEYAPEVAIQGFPNRSKAAAELEKRFLEFGFDVPSEISKWARWA